MADTSSRPFSALDAVDSETPAAFATSARVTARFALERGIQLLRYFRKLLAVRFVDDTSGCALPSEMGFGRFRFRAYRTRITSLVGLHRARSTKSTRRAP